MTGAARQPRAANHCLVEMVGGLLGRGRVGAGVFRERELMSETAPEERLAFETSMRLVEA